MENCNNQCNVNNEVVNSCNANTIINTCEGVRYEVFNSSSKPQVVNSCEPVGVNDKLTEEEIKEIMSYSADMYHRAMVKIAFEHFEKVEDIQEIANKAIQDFAIKELEVCNKHKANK